MGLGHRSTGKWVQLKGGKVILKDGDSHLEYDNIEGKITGMKFLDKEYEGNAYRAFQLHISDGGETYKTEVSCSSGIGRSLLFKLPNVDFQKKVQIAPAVDKEDAKKQSVFISQGGTPVKQYWTKDNPGHMPQMEKVVVGRKEMWDDSKRQEWIEDFYRVNVFPRLPKPEEAAPEPVHSTTSSSEDLGPDGDEDIPF